MNLKILESQKDLKNLKSKLRPKTNATAFGSERTLEDVMVDRADVLSDEDKQRLVGMTEEEREATLLEFKDGKEILEEGAHYQTRSIFQVFKGSCQVKKGDQLLAVLPEGTIFGEMSFLIDDPITASVYASGNTAVRQFSETHLEECFRKNPGLGGRYYEFLCYVLVNRLHRLYVKVSSYDDKAAIADELETYRDLTIGTGGGGEKEEGGDGDAAGVESENKDSD